MRSAGAETEGITEPRRAVAMLHPLRREILERARTSRSATELAAELGLPRQNVSYHLRELFRARLVRRAGRQQKRGFVEQRWVASAQSYVLLPELLGAVGPSTPPPEETVSTATLLALASRTQSEVARAARDARSAGKRLPTLSVDAEIRFTSAAQRDAFSRALAEAVQCVVAEHASPARRANGSPAPGRPYRLVIGSYPIPASTHQGESR